MRRALGHADIAVQEMADHLEMSRAQVSRYLNDKGAPPKRYILREWAMRCGVPLDWLLEGLDASRPGPTGGGGPGPGLYSPWDSNPEPAGSRHERVKELVAA